MGIDRPSSSPAEPAAEAGSSPSASRNAPGEEERGSLVDSPPIGLTDPKLVLGAATAIMTSLLHNDQEPAAVVVNSVLALYDFDPAASAATLCTGLRIGATAIAVVEKLV